MLRCMAGFRSTRRTKIICTIGPTSCSEEMLETLAVNGMNVARLNMCHGSREWHHEIIARIRRLNQDKGCACLLHAHLGTRSTSWMSGTGGLQAGRLALDLLQKQDVTVCKDGVCLMAGLGDKQKQLCAPLRRRSRS